MEWSIPFLRKAEDGYTAIFNESLSEAVKQATWRTYMNERTGLGTKENLEWLNEMLTIDELPTGEMVYASLDSVGHTLVHKDFGKAFWITRPEFVFNEFSKSQQACAQLGEHVGYHPQTMAELLIKNGSNTTQGVCYDGGAFFRAGHPVNGKTSAHGTFTNLNATTALTADNFAARVAAMRSRPMANGIARNFRITSLVVPPALEKTAREITQAKFLASGNGTTAGSVDNVLTAYGIEPVIVPGLSAANGGSDTKWYLFGEHGGPMGKPFIYSRGIDFGLNSYDGISQVELGRMNRVEYQLRGYIAAAYSHPYLADCNDAT